jgi:hypothetical protein
MTDTDTDARTASGAPSKAFRHTVGYVLMTVG